MTYNRDKKGRFSKKSVFFLILIFAVVIFVLFMVGIDKELDIKNQPEVITQVVDKYSGRIADIKKEMLDDLSLNCEVKGIQEPDATIVLDSNNQMSIGRFQFQRDTVVYYVKKFEGRDITKREAIEIAVNPERASALAEKILFSDPNGWKNWLNCSTKLGLEKEIKIINKLSN